MDVTPELVLGGAVALSGCIVWIEKRFRDAKRDADAGILTAVNKLTAELNYATAEHRNAAARLERRNAELNNKIAEIQIGIARDFAEHARNYPTKDDLQQMYENFSGRIDKLEGRIEANFQKRNRSVT